MHRIDSWAVPPYAAATGGEELPAETAYEYFCEFTRAYVGALLDGTSDGATEEQPPPPDVRMPPLTSVRVGDPVHKAALSFAMAQDRVFGPCKWWVNGRGGGGVRGSSSSSSRRVLGPHTTYSDLVLLSAMRILEAGAASGAVVAPGAPPR
jgi:hypothetical protein